MAEPMGAYLLIGAGGAIGAIARFGVAKHMPIGAWPWATFTVNIVGGLLMGLLVGWLAAHGGEGREPWRLFLAVGVLGGFTTFSAFSLEIVLMIQRGDAGLALLYAAASSGVAVAALYLGLFIIRWLPS